jgi:hypothetical protein
MKIYEYVPVHYSRVIITDYLNIKGATDRHDRNQ